MYLGAFIQIFNPGLLKTDNRVSAYSYGYQPKLLF